MAMRRRILGSREGALARRKSRRRRLRPSERVQSVLNSGRRIRQQLVASGVLDGRVAARIMHPVEERISPYLSLVRAPRVPMTQPTMSRYVSVATYNVHRWTGLNGRRTPDPARAAFVISELDADVIALQEVLRPHNGENPLELLCDALGMHLAFAVTRQHKRGELGNAILSRFPMTSASVIDISHSRIEKRGALAARFEDPLGSLSIVATHLSLVDRTRARQVEALLQHPRLLAGPAVLLGDMNAWRRCKGSRQLDDALSRHHNLDWPSSFPAMAPVLALDRVYTRGVQIRSVQAHDTPASRRASDHLPVIANIALDLGA
jgi:endonuclease/exonuclease/phosphatase family metal-dependent hydrolase